LLRRRRDALRAYKKGMMQRLFSQELRFTKPDGSPFPDWQEKRLGDVVKIDMGQSPDSSAYNEDGVGLPLIQGNADILKRKSAPRRFTSEITKTCEIGDTLISVRAPIGEIALAIHHACIGRGIATAKAHGVNVQTYWFQTLLYSEPRWISIGQGSTFAAISGPDIRNLKFWTPHPEEQQKIADTLTALDAKIDAVTAQMDAMLRFKKGLLQQMFV
jgi:type I restriction enzyme, S subunit